METDIETDIELKNILPLVRRWAWLLAMGLVLGALGGLLGSIFQTPVYQASTRLLVMRAPQVKSTDYTSLSDQQLVQTYVQLLTTRPVIEGASATLGFVVDIDQISVQQTRDTQVIQLTVEDQNPQRASDIANVLVQALIKQNEVIQAGRYASAEQNIQTQITQIENQISTMDITTEAVSAETLLQQYQQIYINLINNLEAIRLARLQNTPNVVQIESAVVPERPVRPKPVLNTGLGAVAGLLLVLGIAFLIEYLDDTIRTPEDIERILKLPVIGYIGDINIGQNEVVDLHVLEHPRSPVSEAFRSLRTNLEFTNVDRVLKKILVTSSGSGEGKTMIAVNLAAIIAQGNKRVLLIDADMRRPRIHSIFGVSNRVGLSTLFRGNMTVRSVMRAVDGMENVFVITSGSLPPNPTELLASAKMDYILQEASREVDVIVVDSPPSLVADYQVLSTKLDGVLMVVQPGYTHADAASAMLEQLGRVNARTLGIVLNKIPRNSYYYGGYNHHYNPYKNGEYYQQEQVVQPQLQAENHHLRLLPQTEAQPVEFYTPQDDALEKFFTDLQVRESVKVYSPPQDIPATRNIITRPRQINEVIQPVETLRHSDSKHEPQDFKPIEPTGYVNSKHKPKDSQSVETPVYGGSEFKLEDFQSVESPGYTIERYELEYWYDRKENEKDDE